MAAAPPSILLLHGLGGSGEGSVKVLAHTLRATGWRESVILRPTLRAVHEALPDRPGEQRFREALQELEACLEGGVPALTVGFSYGGLLAAFAPSARRLAVCSPWHRLPEEALARIAARPGLAVLQGGLDSVVPAELSLAALPGGIPAEVDAEGTHDFDAWMDRIAAWIQNRWQD